VNLGESRSCHYIIFAAALRVIGYELILILKESQRGAHLRLLIFKVRGDHFCALAQPAKKYPKEKFVSASSRKSEPDRHYQAGSLRSQREFRFDETPKSEPDWRYTRDACATRTKGCLREKRKPHRRGG
jgi:hypothetical protein